MHRVVEITTSEVLNRLLQAGIKSVGIGTDIMPSESVARGFAKRSNDAFFTICLADPAPDFVKSNSRKLAMTTTAKIEFLTYPTYREYDIKLCKTERRYNRRGEGLATGEPRFATEQPFNVNEI